MRVSVSDWAWFPKVEFTEERLRKLKDRLTIRPKRTHRRQSDPDPVYMYREKEDKGEEFIGVPRSYFMERRHLIHDITIETSPGITTSVPFVGDFKRDQGLAADAVMRNRQTGGLGSIIKASPGWGKTVTALGIWSKIGANALVVVHKSNLLNQWIKRIKGVYDEDGKVLRAGFAPKARVGVIRSSRCDFGPDFDITIATIQSLSRKFDEYPKEMWDSFGLVIADEVHRVAAPTWEKVVPRFKAGYRLGLSATPRRKDRAEDVFFYHIGEVVYASKARMVTPRLRRKYTDFILPRKPSFDPNRAAKEIQLRFLCANLERNKMIIDELLLAVESGRKVVVLSERRKHLERLDGLFKKIKPNGCVTGFYVGGMKQKELDRSELADIIWSTYQMAAEGVDIPSLDTAFLATPMSDVEQSVGRIMREYDDKKRPVITDFIDEGVRSFARLWNTRKAFYIKNGMYEG